MLINLSFDGPTRNSRGACSSCGADYPRVTAFVSGDDRPVAIVFAACHRHDGHSEAWLDVVVGSFLEPEFSDQVTFSCRVKSMGATLFSDAVASEGKAGMFGRMLTEDEARHDDRLPGVWAVVDYVVTHEPVVFDAVYGG